MPKVGLCEDDPAIRRVVNDAMRLAGHDVVLTTPARRRCGCWARTTTST